MIDQFIATIPDIGCLVKDIFRHDIKIISQEVHKDCKDPACDITIAIMYPMIRDELQRKLIANTVRDNIKKLRTILIEKYENDGCYLTTDYDIDFSGVRVYISGHFI